MCQGCGSRGSHAKCANLEVSQRCILLVPMRLFSGFRIRVHFKRILIQGFKYLRILIRIRILGLKYLRIRIQGTIFFQKLRFWREKSKRTLDPDQNANPDPGTS